MIRKLKIKITVFHLEAKGTKNVYLEIIKWKWFCCSETVKGSRVKKQTLIAMEFNLGDHLVQDMRNEGKWCLMPESDERVSIASMFCPALRRHRSTISHETLMLEERNNHNCAARGGFISHEACVAWYPHRLGPW